MLYNDGKPEETRAQATEKRGRLITLEGIDGTGKSTQVANLVSAIRSRGITVLELREPGGTAIGEAIRQILLDKRNIGLCDESELLLFIAARAQLVREIILPALVSGSWVVCDRFTDSTLAYQGYGRGADLEMIRRINDLAVNGCRPDKTILLDVPIEAAMARLDKRQHKSDRLDAEGIDFMKRVRDGYMAMAANEPDRFAVVDTTLPKTVVAQEIFSKIWEGFGT